MIYIIALVILLLDQWFKVLVEQSFNLGQSIPVIEEIFHLTYIQNTGASFGLLKEYTWWITVISLAVLVIFIYFIQTSEFDGLLFKISSGLIVGGAGGNILDRIRMGYVIDYLDFRIWPVFNLADIAIVMGGIIFVVVLFKSDFF